MRIASSALAIANSLVLRGGVQVPQSSARKKAADGKLQLEWSGFCGAAEEHAGPIDKAEFGDILSAPGVDYPQAQCMWGKAGSRVRAITAAEPYRGGNTPETDVDAICSLIVDLAEKAQRHLSSTGERCRGLARRARSPHQ